jgi:hypothetical protein
MGWLLGRAGGPGSHNAWTSDLDMFMWIACKRAARAGWLKTAIAFLVGVPITFAVSGSTSFFSGVASPQNCNIYVPPTPTLNPGPLAYGQALRCADYPLLDAKVLSFFHSPRDARYAHSQQEHDYGIHAFPGDTIRVSIWLNNGADETFPSETIAKNVAVAVYADQPAVGITPERTVDPKSAVLRLWAHAIAGNAAPISNNGHFPSDGSSKLVEDTKYGGALILRTRREAQLEYVPKSTVFCIAKARSRHAFTNWVVSSDWKVSNDDSCDHETQDTVSAPDGVFAPPDRSYGAGLHIGDLMPGYRNALFVIFSVRVTERIRR